VKESISWMPYAPEGDKRNIKLMVLREIIRDTNGDEREIRQPIKKFCRK
jgi:hypothetical protein